MNKMIKKLSYIPVVLLSMTYAIHGIRTLTMGDEYVQIISMLGFDEPLIPILLMPVGILDCCIAILLLFKHQLLPNLNWKYLFIWAGLWPIVPKTIEWMTMHRFEWIAVLIFAFISGFAFYLNQKRIKTI